MKITALWLWCLPQNLLGLLLLLFTKARKVGEHYEYNIGCGSVSLGDYIFLCPSHRNNKTILKHEQGHQIQSRILGWLYLPVIGIPSIIWAGCFGWYRNKYDFSYYDFYTERWADILGGVKRN